MNAYGFAVACPDINIRTVSESKRGAMVNWLYADVQLRFGDTVKDEDIEKQWKFWSEMRGAVLVKVEVRIDT